MADQPKKPYGNVAYADPGFQADKKPRYPIDTQEHCRAAWGYISKPGNADAYSSGDLAKVKAKIVAACKKFGIEISADKTVDPEVAKTLNEESPVADIVDPAEDTDKTVEPVLEKSTEVPDETKAKDVDVPDYAALVKAAVEELRADLTKSITGDVYKSLVGDTLTPELLEKAAADTSENDQPFLNKYISEVVEAETESTKKSVSVLTEEVEKVKSMATPGGPALRQTEIERTNSRVNDLVREVARYKSLASHSDDHDLRKGYATKAAQIEAEIKTLA
jgi:hypothetical protein